MVIWVLLLFIFGLKHKNSVIRTFYCQKKKLGAELFYTFTQLGYALSQHLVKTDDILTSRIPSWVTCDAAHNIQCMSILNPYQYLSGTASLKAISFSNAHEVLMLSGVHFYLSNFSLYLHPLMSRSVNILIFYFPCFHSLLSWGVTI